MKSSKVLILLVFSILLTVPAFAQVANTETPAAAVPGGLKAADLSQYTYSYGTVLKVSDAEIVLQEYDYDSDVEKEISYQIDPAIKLDGIKAVSDLTAEDVVEVYYSDKDGKKTAKIIRREVIEEENTPPENS